MAFWNKKKEANITAEDSLCTMKVAVAGMEDANKRTLTDLSSQGISAYGISTSNPVEEEEDVKPAEEEYIWVDGYKALYPSMKASYGDITYEVGKEFALPDGEDPQVCNRGFHFCLNHIYLKQYVSYGRVFKVRAEVKKSDYDKFGEDGTYTYERKNSSSDFYFPGYRPSYGKTTVDKLAARKIILTEEITDFDFIKETFNMPIYVKTQEDYEDFLHYINSGFSTTHWYLKKFCEAMETYGYAEPFCTIVFRQLGDYAYKCKHISDFAAGLDLMNLSMDMKVYLVLEEAKKMA